MNFALIVDKCVQNSFYVKDKQAYKMVDDSPYVWHHSIDGRCSMGPFAYPFLFEGHLINWPEWDVLPELDLDVIFLVIEKNNHIYDIDQVRKKYPNAKIYATIKELYFYDGYEARIDLFQKADAVVIPYKESIYEIFPNLEKDVGHTLHYLPQPYDIDFLYERFYKQNRLERIFSYIPPHPPRRGHTEEFANYLGDKYDIPVTRRETGYSPTQWLDFLNMFSESTFCVNCDPEPQQGQQGIQCAILGVVNIGGINDSHHTLFPQTANNDFAALEEEFIKYIGDTEYRISRIKDAFDKANAVYSFEATLKQFNEIQEITE